MFEILRAYVYVHVYVLQHVKHKKTIYTFQCTVRASIVKLIQESC